jgi:hypothetical protein
MASTCGKESSVLLGRDNFWRGRWSGVDGGWSMEEIFDNGMQPTYFTLNVLCTLTQLK